MKKILLSLIFSVVVTGCNSSAQAQQAGKTYLIGVLISGSPSNAAPRIEALKQGLRAFGYAEGKNITLEYRYGEGKPETLPDRAAELVNLNVDLILADTSNAIEAVKAATQKIPVVFTLANDPIGDGQVASLAKPGGNLTGFAIFATELNGKRLELLQETVPKVTRVAYLIRSDISRAEQRRLSELRFKEAEIAAKKLGLRLLSLGAKGAEDLESGFEAAKSGGAEALMISPSTFAALHRRQLIALAATHRLPTIYPSVEYAEAAGLMSYGPDLVDNYRRAAAYIDKIVKGAQPGDLPIQQPTKFQLVINLKTAKQIGLIIPPNVLVRADRVIK
jgi:putative ABC transport system substrate-binding protein